MPRPSGWYDDPDDDSLLRYWDGVIWTSHTASKRPTPRPGGTATWSDPAQAPERWPGLGSGQRPQVSGRGNAAGDPRRGTRTEDRGVLSPRFAADGTRLAGWWRRVFAYLVDMFVTMLLVAPIVQDRAVRGTEGFSTWWESAMRAAQAGQDMPVLSEAVARDLAFIAIVQLAVYLVYEVAFVARTGRSLGRLLTGIRVRAVGADAAPALNQVLSRTAVKCIAELTAPLGFLGSLASLFRVADFLWPISDRHSQALHDKVARTEVVRATRGRQGGAA